MIFPPRASFLGALCLCASSSATAPRQQASVRCAIYEAAIHAVNDSERLVVIDSTSDGVPMFAFMAVSGSPHTPAQQGLPLSDSLLQALHSANQSRESLTPCLVALRDVQPVSDDSLIALFGRDAKGWTRFRARYSGIRRFVLLSRPLMLSDSAALVYTASASDWLAGEGVVLRLERDSGGHWGRKASAVLWIS